MESLRYTFCLLLMDTRLVMCEQVLELYAWKNFTEAKLICQERGEFFHGYIFREEDRTKMENTMKVDPVWINLKIRRYQTLTWTTGTKVDDRRFGLYDAQCGITGTADRKIYELSCAEKHFALCQVEDCVDCPSGTHCVVQGETCYFSSSTEQNWYAGQTLCSSLGGRLAVFENANELNKIPVSNWPGVDVLWLGSRTIDWTVTENSFQWIQTYSWLPGQPKYYKDCVVLTREQEKLGWKSKDCSEYASVVCIRKSVNHAQSYQTAATNEINAGTKTTQTDSVTQDPCDKETLPTEDTPLLAPLIIVSVILVLVFGSFIYVCRTRKRVQNEKQETTNQAVKHEKSVQIKLLKRTRKTNNADAFAKLN